MIGVRTFASFLTFYFFIVFMYPVYDFMIIIIIIIAGTPKARTHFPYFSLTTFKFLTFPGFPVWWPPC